jgi:hypothetical protein
MKIPNTLIHYYNDKKYIFNTITELSPEELDSALDIVSDPNFWFGHRFSKENRADYLHFRIHTENRLYRQFSDQFFKPQTKHPFYMYLNNKDIKQRIAAMDATNSLYFSLNLSDIKDRSNISFTVSDSMWSFGFQLFRDGIIDWDPSSDMKEKEYHGKLFHINQLKEIISQYNLDENQTFEVQFWDKSILKDFLSKANE